MGLQEGMSKMKDKSHGKGREGIQQDNASQERNIRSIQIRKEYHRDIPYNGADVIVSDGFTGNMILKLYEGVAMALMDKIKGVFLGSVKGKLAAAMVYSDLKKLKKELDYNEYGGAPIMGVPEAGV